jgi:mono/diheme cytochrome c family protein
MVIPGLVAGFLFLLPFLDRGDGRHPLRGSRRWLSGAFITIGAGVVTLTVLGLADRPAGRDPNDWGLVPIAGMQMATTEGASCARCHVSGGPATSLSKIRLTKDDEWLLSHMADPIAIAPGVRPVGEPAPKPVLSRFQAQAVVAFLRRQYAGDHAPILNETAVAAAHTYAEVCAACHKMAGDGGTVGPDLTRVGSRRTESEIRRLIEDPLSAYADSVMPPFKDTLSAEQIAALAKYLASRR